MKKMSRILTVIAVVMALLVAFTSCELFNTPVEEGHKCESVCATCNKCTDAACTEDACKDKCQGHTTNPPAPVETTPTISVNPPAIEIHAGDDIDLLFGVTVTDEGDDAPTLIIEDDDGFDAEVEGVYTITYKAVNKFGKTATATRTVTVVKALSALTLETKANRLGENKWQGTSISFKNSEFVTLTGNYSSDVAISGVFYNSTASSITINIPGGYGVAAVIDANGFVIEGRDGANSKLVNAANPDRASTSVGSIEIGGETVTVASAFAKELVVPAGGYAIVVQNGYCGTTVDNDGRGFMNYNVIYQYGNVVRLLWADTQEVLTPYVDQAPVITGHNNKVFANLTDAEFDLTASILADLKVTDDNGTFDPSDDISVTITVANDGGFDVNVAGSYTVTLTATDGTNTTTVTRVVEVVDNLVSVTINDKTFNLLPEKIVIDQDITVLGGYLFVVYTPNYNGTLNWSNGWGEAFVLNQYGQIVRIYDGANGKYYDADNKGGIVDATKCTAAGYLTEAFNSLQDGEYLIVAPNGNGNVSRGFFTSNRTIGAQMGIPGITFPNAPHMCENVCPKCGKCTSECADEVCAEKCEGHAHECESVCPTCGKCQDVACTEAVCAEKCGCHECESVCEHCGKCTDAECLQAACTEKCAGHENSKFITINGKKFEAVDGKWAYNTEITATNAASKAMWIFDKNYTGSFATNSYGAAIVLDQYGTLVKVYDGANVGFYTKDGKAASAHFTSSNYAVVAWNELQEGEILIVFPNDGATNASRGFALGLRTDGSIGKVATVSDMTFKSLTKTITVNGKSFTAENGMWAYNTEITATTAASKAMWIFDKNYTGDFATNGYGAAIVIDANGTLVKVYDGANVGFYTKDGKAASAHFTSSNYAVTAWNELQEGEILIVFPNDGATNASRGFALGLRTDGSIGKTVTLTDFDFEG